jgi:hypothetical protein
VTDTTAAGTSADVGSLNASSATGGSYEQAGERG